MYLDPGSGSIILQLVLAGLLAVGVFFRLFANKVRALFGKKSSPAGNPEETE
jgi:hypothetical protein